MLGPGVCPSVTSLSSVKTAEQIDLVFGTQATLGLSYVVSEENSGISKNRGTLL